ncbi:MAG: hypothetical protein JWO88_713 [Frankiales bacterium]|nr:hypothetical protein [Frankiales bacterium]
MANVKLLARWVGWCDPCETERPLILTETGERGPRAWFRGIGAEDRDLTLTCGVCGEWQDVPHEDDDFDPAALVGPSPLVAVRPLGVRQVVLSSRATPAPTDAVPAPRDGGSHDGTLGLLADGLDLIGASAA